MQLTEEWLPFKYNNTEDIQPCWKQTGFYETRYDAFSAFMNIYENSVQPKKEGLPDL